MILIPELERYITDKAITWLDYSTNGNKDIFELYSYVEYKENMPYELFLDYQNDIVRSNFYIYENEISINKGYRILGFGFKDKSYEKVKEKALMLLEYGFKKQFNFRDEVESSIKIEVSNHDFVPKQILDYLEKLSENNNLKLSSINYSDDGSLQTTAYKVIYTGDKK